MFKTKLKNFINAFVKILRSIGSFFRKLNDYLVDGIVFLLKHYGVYLMLIFITAVAYVCRVAFIKYESGDTRLFLEPWIRFIRHNGGLASLDQIPISYYQNNNQLIPYVPNLDTSSFTGTVYGNYPTFYYFLIAVFSYLPISDLAVIKHISYMFDIIMAVGVFYLVKHFSKKNNVVSVIAFALSLLLPTILINSSIWGQSDAIYGGMAVWFIYFLIKEKPGIAMIFIGIGLSIKLQTVFILPLVGFLFLKKKFNLFYLAVPVLVVFASFLPAYIAGAPFKMPIDQFISVAGTYSSPNMNSGSIYAFFQGLNSNGNFIQGVKAFGIPFAFAVLITFIYVFYEKKVDINPYTLVAIGTLFAFLTPFVLPHMHERYFFMGDILIVVYVIIFKRRWFLLVLSQLASLLTYSNFILGGWFIKLPVYVNGFPTGTVLRYDATPNLILAALLNIVIIGFITSDIVNKEKMTVSPSLTTIDELN